ncbi:hypothetical protein C8R44DRAFT_740502 [Mycena epipterygia]|nr:hypothetical protein C8R44DRAFT_887180 [Mycena epipterygia]KAJ7114364.1 hypothetical protein C8R44DRAFT_740502 [Mycena epipterygia]
MPPAGATFCNLPLSASFDPHLEKSVLSLDWILTNDVTTAALAVLSLPYGDTSCALLLFILIMLNATTTLIRTPTSALPLVRCSGILMHLQRWLYMPLLCIRICCYVLLP